MGKLKHSRFDCTPGCSVEAAIGLLDGKWKSIILWHLLEDDVLRLTELRSTIPYVTPKMLTRQIRELEEYQLMIRKAHAVVRPNVGYLISTLATSLAPFLLALYKCCD